jgi:hypothetical protein
LLNCLGARFKAYVNFRKRKTSEQGYRELVDRWANEFGKENIIVRLYQCQQNKLDIVTDILQAMGLDSVVQQEPVYPEGASFLVFSFSDVYRYLSRR